LLYFTYIRGLGADEDRYIRSHDGRTLTPNMVMFKLKKNGRSSVNLKTFICYHYKNRTVKNYHIYISTSINMCM